MLYALCHAIWAALGPAQRRAVTRSEHLRRSIAERAAATDERRRADAEYERRLQQATAVVPQCLMLRCPPRGSASEGPAASTETHF